MHEETYPAFFTPRDEEPSLSSSEEKSSEFDWLEIKIMRKQKYMGKTEQVLCEIYFLLLQKVVSKNKLPRSLFYIVKKITTIYKRLFTLCSYLKTKESYDRWVTRRLWGFRQQISKAKYLKMSVGNIRKLQEKFRCIVQKWLSRESKLSATDALRVSTIRRSRHV